MNDDFSDVINKFSEILKEKNIDLNSIKNSITNASSNSNHNSNPSSSSDFNLNSDPSSNSNFNLNSDPSSNSNFNLNSNSSFNSDFSSGSNCNSSLNSDSNYSPNSGKSSNDFSLDIEMIMKIKNILGKLNSCQDCPRNHLLNSLKPYLENEKKEKLDKYIQIANLINVMENMDLSPNFINENKKGYDFLLIITLVLLIL